jgi:hypothetical protein
VSGRVTEDKLEQLFRAAKNSGFETANGDIEQVPFDHPDDGCFARAHHMAKQVLAAGFPCKKIFAHKTPYAGERPLQVVSEVGFGGRANAPVEVTWLYHVAIALDVVDEHGGVREMVIDPSTSPDAPISTAEWLSGMGVETEKGYEFLGRSFKEAVDNLVRRAKNAALLEALGMAADERDPDAVDDFGYPMGRTSVYTAEPAAYYQVQADEHGNSVYPGPPDFTMDDAEKRFQDYLPKFTEQAEAARRRREVVEAERKAQRDADAIFADFFARRTAAEIPDVTYQVAGER